MAFLRSLSRCSRAVAVALLVVCSVALVATTTHAQKSTAELADRLRNASDFRVRVQAALALGASKSADAVQPLCDGLDDSNATVRSAAAAALGRLALTSGLPCLKKKAGSESNSSVKTQIQQSISKIESGGGGGSSGAAASKAPDSSSKWYVAVGTTKNKSDRDNAEIDTIVQTALRKGLAAKDGVAIAPPTETAAQAGGVIQKHHLTGYFLQTTVEPPRYEDSKLTVTVRVTMFTYPNKALQGEFAPKLTQSGTPSKDKASEDELIRMAVERAVAKFISVLEAQSP
jgi:hypothetical protein